MSASVESFKARYPEFINVSDALIELLFEENASISCTFPEADRERVCRLLTAHSLAMEGEPARSNAIASGKQGTPAGTGAIVEMQDGDVRVEFSDAQANALSAASSRSGSLTKFYLQTPYGRDYLALQKRNVGTVRVVGCQ